MNGFGGTKWLAQMVDDDARPTTRFHVALVREGKEILAIGLIFKRSDGHQGNSTGMLRRIDRKHGHRPGHRNSECREDELRTAAWTA